MRRLILSAAIVIGAAFAAPAMASEAVPQDLAQRLDQAEADFTMTAAKRRRLMMMQNAQPRYGRGPGYGPRPGYYGRGPGYGPRPGYYGRGPGYAPRPGYGPRPGYRPPPRW
jgi:hypothetical protein